MKYFSKQLFLESISDDTKVAEKAGMKWKRYQHKYFDEDLKRDWPFFPNKLRSFIDKVSLHDGVLLSLSFGDYLHDDQKWKQKRNRYVQINLFHPEGKYVYTLLFSKVRILKHDYPTEQSLLDQYSMWGTDTWAFDGDIGSCTR